MTLIFPITCVAPQKEYVVLVTGETSDISKLITWYRDGLNTQYEAYYFTAPNDPMAEMIGKGLLFEHDWGGSYSCYAVIPREYIQDG
jgi:hypothetical protein